MMDVLLPSVALMALLAGPVFWHFSARSASLASAVDGFAITAVGGLTLLLIAPGALAAGGLWALALMIIGLFLPRLLHQLGPRGAGSRADRALLAGLVLHAAIESAALAASADGSHLGLAIAAHRVPVGLAVFMLAPSTRDGWIAVGLIMLASLVGYISGHSVPLLSAEHHAWLDGFVAGSLLHVIQGHHADHDHGPACDHELDAAPAEPVSAHHHHGDHDHAHYQHDGGGFSWHAAAGALAGCGVVAAAMIEPHGHHHLATDQPHLLDQFLALALISAPALVAGYLLAGLVSGLLGPKSAAWLGRGNRLSQAARGVAVGLPLPVCSCGVLPVYESLLRRGAAPAAGLAFLIATPELGIDALAISLPLLGADLTLVRLLTALLVALLVALLLAGGAQLKSTDPIESIEKMPERTWLQRLHAGLRFGLVELFDHTMPWVLAGLFLAALMTPLLDAAALSALSPVLQVPLLTLLAIPAYVCASGATPVAAIALQAGLSPGAAMAFLIAGPATNITTFGILSRLHSPRFALSFGVAMALAAMLAGWVINQMAFEIPALDLDLTHDEPATLQVLCLSLLTGLLLVSLFRQGPRGMLTQVMSPFRA